MSRHRNGYPIKLERSYYRSLVQLTKSWQKIAERVINGQIKQYVVGGTKILTDADNSDNPDWINYVQQELNLLAINIENAQTDQQLESMVTKYVYSVNQFSAHKTRHHQTKIQMQIGVNALNPLRDSPKLQEYTHNKIIENTNLIKSYRGQYINWLRNDIYRDINAGKGITDLVHDLSKRTGMALRHADLIATDQTGKILAQIDSYRNQQAGSTRYIWRSMEDNRVRPKHRELDGKEFKYDDPNGGDNGQLPGEPIRCRCYADPID